MLDAVLEIGKAFSVERRSLLSVKDVGFWKFPWWLPSKSHPLRVGRVTVGGEKPHP